MNRTIDTDLILPRLKAMSKKQAFQVLAREAAKRCGLPEKDILRRLLEKETRSSSGIGDGVAIPHLRFRRLNRPFVIFAQLDRPIAYDALDNHPVDLICVILSADKDGPLNLQRLSVITRVLRNARLRQRLRESRDRDSLEAALIESGEATLAA